jgi:gamma-glutamylcyclotransferase (GGCT)/AIG2-like uncharacterized protein YtfP
MRAPIIFVYGTLGSPQVVQILLGRALTSSLPAARLLGYTRYPVRNFVFPGTIPTPDQPSSAVDGYLLEDLTPLERKLLDWFEGDEYDRRLVQVEREDTATLVPAEVYIWKQHLIGELEQGRDWSYELFLKDHMESYLDNTVRPCREEMEQLGMTREE